MIRERPSRTPIEMFGAPTVVTPVALFQDLRLTARKVVGTGPGWNADFGHGIIDPVAVGRRRGLIWRNGEACSIEPLDR